MIPVRELVFEHCSQHDLRLRFCVHRVEDEARRWLQRCRAYISRPLVGMRRLDGKKGAHLAESDLAAGLTAEVSVAGMDRLGLVNDQVGAGGWVFDPVRGGQGDLAANVL
jgi:hypothetical protein